MSDFLGPIIVNLIVRIDVFKVWERKLHRRYAVGCVLDVIDGKIVRDGRTTPNGIDVDEVPLYVEHVIPHYCKQTDGLTIVMQFIAGDDVRVTPKSAQGSGTSAEFFVEGHQ